MTDKEKLDKLVAEIERRKNLVDDPILSDNDLIIGERNTYVRLLSFYRSMQEEPKSKCKGCNNVKGCITCVDGSEYAHIEECNITGVKSKYATGKLKECIDNVSEEGLEEARKQLQELVNGGLDEEINRYIEQHNSEFSGYFFNLRRIAWYFANWQAQQMIKDAVDGTFSTGELADGTPIDAIFNFDKLVRSKYEEGEKLKLIVIKK